MDPPRTHDLALIASLPPASIGELAAREDMDGLTPLAVEAKYPLPRVPLDLDDAEVALDVARAIRTVIREHLAHARDDSD